MRNAALLTLLLLLGCNGADEPDSSTSSRTVETEAPSPDRSTDVAEPDTVEIETADGVTLYADVWITNRTLGTPIVILLHQARGDARGEYGPIIPRLTEHGVNVIAVDLRSGGDRFGGVNRTVEALGGEEYGYCDGTADVRAAAELPEKLGLEGPIYLWGSSYSAALAINVAAELPKTEVVRVLAFSPASSGPMAECSPNETIEASAIPILLFRPDSEMENPSVRQQLELAKSAGHDTYVMEGGVHGSSMLVAERTEGDPTEAWQKVFAFIDDPDSRH